MSCVRRIDRRSRERSDAATGLEGLTPGLRSKPGRAKHPRLRPLPPRATTPHTRGAAGRPSSPSVRSAEARRGGALARRTGCGSAEHDCRADEDRHDADADRPHLTFGLDRFVRERALFPSGGLLLLGGQSILARGNTVSQDPVPDDRQDGLRRIPVNIEPPSGGHGGYPEHCPLGIFTMDHEVSLERHLRNSHKRASAVNGWRSIGRVGARRPVRYATAGTTCRSSARRQTRSPAARGLSRVTRRHRPAHRHHNPRTRNNHPPGEHPNEDPCAHLVLLDAQRLASARGATVRGC